MQLRNRAVSQPVVEKTAEPEPEPEPEHEKEDEKNVSESDESEVDEADKSNEATPEPPRGKLIPLNSDETIKIDSDDEEEEEEEEGAVAGSEVDEAANHAEKTPEPAGDEVAQSDSDHAIQIDSDGEDDDDDIASLPSSSDLLDEEDDEENDQDEGVESENGVAEPDVEMIVDTSEQHKSSPNKRTAEKRLDKVDRFRNHRLPLTCVCLHPSDKYAYTASKDGSIIKWCMSTRRILKKINSIRKQEAQSSKKLEERNHVKNINAIAISDDGKFLATGGWDKKVRVWSPDDLQWLHTFTLHRQEITALAFRRGHHMLYSGSADRSVMLWTLEDDENRCFVESLIGHESPITSMDTTRKERVLTSGGRDQSIRIWKIVEQAQTVFQSKHQSVDVARFINDQLFVSSGEDGHITLWTTMKRSPLCSIKAHGTDKKSNLNYWVISLATFYLKQAAKQMTGGKTKTKTTKASGKSTKRRKLDDYAAGQMDDDDEDDEDDEESGDEEAAGSDEENMMSIVEQQSDSVIALIASGSCDSKLHIWKLVKNSLELHQTIECPGYINDLKFTSDGSRIVAACAKEHRFGRWTVDKGAKNCWRVFDLNKL